MLQGFCDHNRRNQHNVEERLDRLEVVSSRLDCEKETMTHDASSFAQEMRAKKVRPFDLGG